MSVALSIILTGCLKNPPKPYSYDTKNQSPNVSNEERQFFLEKIMHDRTHHRYKRAYKVKEGCFKFYNTWSKTKKGYEYIEKMNNCFVADGEIINRVDLSKCSTNYGKTYGKCSYIGQNVGYYADELNYYQDKLMGNIIEKE